MQGRLDRADATCVWLEARETPAQYLGGGLIIRGRESWRKSRFGAGRWYGLSIFLRMYFDEQTLLILIKSNLTAFFFYWLVCVISNSSLPTSRTWTYSLQRNGHLS